MLNRNPSLPFDDNEIINVDFSRDIANTHMVAYDSTCILVGVKIGFVGARGP